MKPAESVEIRQRGIMCQGCGKIMVSTTARHTVVFKVLGKTALVIACMGCNADDLESAYKPIN